MKPILSLTVLMVILSGISFTAKADGWPGINCTSMSPAHEHLMWRHLSGLYNQDKNGRKLWAMCGLVNDWSKPDSATWSARLGNKSNQWEEFTCQIIEVDADGDVRNTVREDFDVEPGGSKLVNFDTIEYDAGSTLILRCSLPPGGGIISYGFPS